MAAARLNVFDNLQLGHMLEEQRPTNGSLGIHAVVFPGSISFNTVAFLLSAASASQSTARTASLGFGLYSRNGATLSLANSASGSFTNTASAVSWMTLATSATQDITPGNWYLAFTFSTSQDGRVSLFCNSAFSGVADAAYGGPFFRGHYSATTNAFPASIATSDMNKEGGTGGGSFHPYILISA